MSAQKQQSAHAENLQEFMRMCNNIADGVHDNIHTVLKTEDINFTGGLDNSFVKGVENDFVILVSTSPYAIPVDRGMPAGHNVNWDGLNRWVKGKLGITDEDEAATVTWKIQHKIHEKGIKPTRFVKKAIKMFINKHGYITLRKPRDKSSKLVKQLKRLGRYIKKYSKKLYKMYKKGHKMFNKVLGVTSKLIKQVRRV